MNLLVHTCCAPCAICVIDEAKKDNLDVTGFFSNSNIHPRPEYLKRMEAARKYFRSEGREFIFLSYEPANFFMGTPHFLRSMGTPHFLGISRKNGVSPKSGVSPSGVSPNGVSPRCSACWEMRLEETVSFAKENGFDFFTTTLLGSPYQDHDALRGICEDLSRKKKVRFYYKDFRTGFRRAHNIAREKGIYCQNYCGCVFSMIEREEARKRKITSSLRGGRRPTKQSY